MIDTPDSIDKALQQGDSIDQALQQGDSIDQALQQGETQVAPEPVQEEQLELPQEDAPTENQDVEQPQKVEAPQEVEESQESQDDDEDEGLLSKVGGWMEDGFLMVPRGLEAAVEGAYDLVDTISEQFADDGLPDWNRKDNNFFGTAKTGAGRFGVGLVQFAAGLIPGFGAVSLLGKVSKATRLTSALSKGKGVLKSYSENKLSLSPDTMKKLSKLKAPTKKNIELATAGTISEFLVFKGQQERLSNMLATHEGGGGPVQDIINWMAYDPNAENHNEFIERGKTALEGLIVGEALGFAGMGLFKGYKKYNPKREGTVTSEDVIGADGKAVPPEVKGGVRAITKIFSRHADYAANLKKQKDAGETPDVIQAADDAIKNNPIDQDDLNALSELDQSIRDAENAQTHQNITGVDPETAPRPEGVQEAQDNIKDAPVPKVKEIDPEEATIEEVDEFLREHGIQTATLTSDSKRAYAKDILEQSKEGGTEQLISKVEQHVVKVVKDAGLYDTTNTQSMLSGIRVLNSVTEMRAFLGHVAKVALKASKQGKMSPEAREKFLEETRKITVAGMEGAGGKGELDLTPFRDRVEDLQFVRSEAETLYDAMNSIAKDLEDKVTNAAAALKNKTVQANVNGKATILNEEEAMTEVFSAMDRWAALQEIWSDFGTQLSLGLRQRNDLYRTGQSSLGRDIAGQHRTLGVALEDAMKRQGQVFRRENKGVVSNKRIIKDLQKLFKKSEVNGPAAEGMEQMVKDFNQVGVNRGLSQWTLAGRKGLAVSQEWYYNAILGSPTSWAVNFLGGALVLPLRHIESIAGGVMTGDVDLVKANFRVMFNLQSFADSVKFMWKSGGEDEARSIVGYTAYRDDRMFAPKGEIRVDNPDGTLMREAINWIGKGIRFPSRIMMMGDEFFKQMSYRARIKTSLALDGYRKGLHREPGALAKHIEEGFNTTITEKGRFRNEQNVQREAIEALAEARKKGEDIPNERDFVNTYVKDHYSNNNLERVEGIVYGDSIGFEEREALVEAGTEWALVNTFTNKVDNAFFKATGDMAQMSPWLGFVIPFVRTPSNIILFALGRTMPRVDKIGKQVMSGLSQNKAIKDIDVEEYVKAYAEKADIDDMPEARKMAQSYLDTIQSGNSIQSAEALGRLSTGIMSVGTLLMHIEAMGDRITGSAPKDPGKREAWEATGKREFSIKWGDTWYSYQRLDPFATTLGIMADIAQGYADTRDTGVSEFGDEDEFEEKQEGLMRLGAILATSFANNVSNKSYIENLGELLDMLEKPSEAIPNIGSNIVAGFVPNGLNWTQNIYEEEPAILEARGFLDKLRKRIPEAMRPGEKLMPRLNALGEEMRKSKTTTGSLGKALNPFFSSETSDDIVNMEIEHQAVGRRRMAHSRSIGGKTVDYRDYRNENGDTAYHRMQKLSGTIKLGPGQFTLRQALRNQIQSNDYQYLPPVTEKNRHKDHPRTKALTKTINKYRAHARRQTEQEFKELRADLAELLR